MDIITFNSHIAKGIFTESRFYAKHPKWPYLDYEKRGRSLYSGNNSFVECGYSFPHNITSVYWITGKISYKHLLVGHTAISYDFMGCYMAKIKIDGFWYIFHIHSSNGDSSDCKRTWLDFKERYRQRITEIHEFRPIKPNDGYYSILLNNKIERNLSSTSNKSKIMDLSGCGIITADNSFYSAIIDRNSHLIYDGKLRKMDPCPVHE